MTKFKKIDISAEDYKELIEEVVNTFYEEDGDSYGEDLDAAIRKHVFNVPDPFDPDA